MEYNCSLILFQLVDIEFQNDVVSHTKLTLNMTSVVINMCRCSIKFPIVIYVHLYFLQDKRGTVRSEPF